MSHNNWRELAERATKEQDPEALMTIVEELTQVLSGLRQALNRAGLH